MFINKAEYSQHSCGRIQGFTIVELVTVIVILGILAIYAAPKILSSSMDSMLAAERALVGNLRLQQQRAMSNVSDENAYGLDLINVEGMLRISTVHPIQDSESFNFAGLTTDTPLTIRFNRQGCVGTCGQSDIEISIQGQQSSHVCINRQGYIFSGRC